MQKAALLNDLRAGFGETFSADVMLWLIDGQTDRTVVVTRNGPSEAK